MRLLEQKRPTVLTLKCHDALRQDALVFFGLVAAPLRLSENDGEADEELKGPLSCPDFVKVSTKNLPFFRILVGGTD